MTTQFGDRFCPPNSQDAFPMTVFCSLNPQDAFPVTVFAP